ncbi:TMAO reductase system periplasmic protein TorT [Marivita sp. S6314]|uniref:TMAO reductase system periplasmic protein TorT n=1 Tax=Marivita sp. S6314 TaxID=2926406 RepID=UPI001FF6AB2D|nr:TMAO reductase system periplasmic protein TorT [Marivita sp. S6314]MCK0151593.1 TMAO reductase system periplasmic protein TorT [Marivita sp. S6314]
MSTVILCALLGTAATAASKPLICVLVPHFKDEYWLSVGYGLEQEAARQNVDLLFYQAGGYRARSAQIAQLDACVTQKMDAILLGSVTSDHPDMTAAIARVSKTTPIFALVNDLRAKHLSGRIGVDWTDMGQLIGDHLRQLHPAGTPPVTAVFLTGPAEAGWTAPLETGLRAGLSQSAVTIAAVLEADTGLRAQLALVERALQDHPTADYLIGNAPAIEAAFGLFAARTDTNAPKLISTYVNHSVRRGLQNGQVLAAPFDDPVAQGIEAIRQVMMAQTPKSSPAMIGPKVVLLTHGDPAIRTIQTSPAGYFPAIQ